MQEGYFVPKDTWLAIMTNQERLEKRINRLEQGMSEYVDTREAERITGIGRDALYNARMANKVVHKYEGRKVLYLRTSLEEYNERHTPRRKRA